MNHTEIAELMGALAPVIGDFVTSATGPLRAQNLELQNQIVGLKSQLDNLPSQEAMLAEFVKAIPSAPEPINLVELNLYISKKLTELVEALPKPENGKDAEPVDLASVHEFILQSVHDAAARIPVPENGKDADPEHVAELVLASLPKPRDGIDGARGEPGASVMMADIVPLIAEGINTIGKAMTDRVEEAIAAIPEVKDGKDGTSVTLTDISHLINDELSTAICDVKKIANDRIEEAIAAIPEIKDGIDGKDGKDGTSVTIEDIVPLVAWVKETSYADVQAAIAAIPEVKDGIDGKDGKDGVDGKDGISVSIDDVLNEIHINVAKAVAAIPEAKNGVDGKDGTSVTLDDVMPIVMKATSDLNPMIDSIIEEKINALPPAEHGAPGKNADSKEVAELLIPEVERAIRMLPPAKDGKDGIGMAAAFIDRDGQLVVTLTDGKTHPLGRVVGKDVDMDMVLDKINSKIADIPRPKDGVDGFGFDSMDLIEIDGSLALAFSRGEETKTFPLPVPSYKDVWREQAYKKGDLVTFGGSVWIARSDTVTKPDTADSDWKLVVKRGRDGQSAYDIARKNGFKGAERDWLESLRQKPKDSK